MCVNRFEPLLSKAGDSDELMECLSGDEHTNSGLDVQLVGDVCGNQNSQRGESGVGSARMPGR